MSEPNSWFSDFLRISSLRTIKLDWALQGGWKHTLLVIKYLFCNDFPMTTLILIQKASEGQQSAAHPWYIMNLDQSQHKRQRLQRKLCITLKGPSADPRTTWRVVRWFCIREDAACKCRSCNVKRETLVIIEIDYKNPSDKYCSFLWWPWDRPLVGWLSALKQEYQTWAWSWARFGKLQPVGQMGQDVFFSFIFSLFSS